MKLGEYRLDRMTEVESFVNYWNEKSKSDPGNYPATLDEDEWNERFFEWKQNKQENYF